MLLSRAIYSVDTLYNITQTHYSKKPRRFPKLPKYIDQPKKQYYISIAKIEERVEIENDATTKIAAGDRHYFPPNFHHIPAEKCKTKIMKHDSPWNENFGNKEKTSVKGQSGCGETENRKKKDTQRTKREMFVDIQVGILKCMIPQIGLLYDLEKAKQKRKRKEGKHRASA